MSEAVREKESLHITPEQLFTAVRAVSSGASGRDNPEDPMPPGPWSPLIRTALERLGPIALASPFSPRVPPDPVRPEWLRLLATLRPELWELVGGGFGGQRALNPQPVPPRTAFLAGLAAAVAERALLLRDIADWLRPRGAEQAGIIIIGGIVSRFVDDICGTPFRPRWPFPWPPPPWFVESMSMTDFLAIGAEFDRQAAETVHADLRAEFKQASEKLARTAMSR